MNNQTKISLLIIALSVVVLGALMAWATKANPTQTSPDMTKGWTTGPADAKVKIVEFADFQCPACAYGQPIIDEIIKEYEGKISYTYRHYPLPQHNNAYSSAQIAEIAGEKGKFFEAVTKIYANQGKWAENSDPAEEYSKILAEIGINDVNVKALIDSNQFKDKIREDKSEGDRLGVDATPTFFINGEKRSGALSKQEWQKIIDSQL